MVICVLIRDLAWLVSLAEHGHVTDAAAVPDGRPLASRGDYLVLAPYQHLWLHE